MRTRAWRRYQVDVHLNRRLKNDRASHSSESVPHYIDNCGWDAYEDTPDTEWSTCKGRDFSVYYARPENPARSVCPCFYDVAFIARLKEQPQGKISTRLNRAGGRRPDLQKQRAIAREHDEY